MAPRPHPHSIQIGARVSFRYHSPTRGWLTFEGTVMRWRKDRQGPMGWLDVKCTDQIERSVRPNAATLI
jgi:hypothetical protein